ncbi:MAG: short-chain dehydrogenase/reductase [Bacteroidetes bacterium]|nr:MAG: short-chain dehydrogenase/reductase [Bacteroidota bacterium]
MSNSKTWFITGASQGLGLTLVKKLLENGYCVSATSRDAVKLAEAVGVDDAKHFLPLAVDLGNADAIDQSVRLTIDTFGKIDVVVNNAGYGMIGIAEQIPGQEIRKIFDVNVIAQILVTKSVLPFMRKQRSGYIINMGSVAGFVGAPGWSVYSATKAAIAAFSEVLALDVREFGIHVTVAEPSGLRTGFLTEHSLANNDIMIEGYEAVKKTQQQYLATNGKQPGDPGKAAEILMELAEKQQPPMHLYLGEDAYKRASAKLASMTTELEEWKSITISADFR